MFVVPERSKLRKKQEYNAADSDVIKQILFSRKSCAREDKEAVRSHFRCGEIEDRGRHSDIYQWTI